MSVILIYLSGSKASSSYGPEHYRKTLKFEEEARMMLGVSMVKEQNKITGVRCPLFDYLGKNIVGMKKWNKLVRQSIKEAKESGSKTYWVSKIPRPVGKEIFECDDLAVVPRVGKKTVSLVNAVGLYIIKDVKDLHDVDEFLSSALNVSDKRRQQISSLIQQPDKPSPMPTQVCLLLVPFLLKHDTYTQSSLKYINRCMSPRIGLC